MYFFLLGVSPLIPRVLFYAKSTKKPAPGKSPGVPLQRSSVRFSNSALWASDTKNLFTLAPRRFTEIFLMGQYQKNKLDSRLHGNDGKRRE
jgi:hypothetical protein